MLKSRLQFKPQAKNKKFKKQSPIAIFAKEIYKQFKARYSNDKDFYNRKIANEIISNETAHIVALFKDYLISDDTSEFLQRFYRKDESLLKLPKIYDYYHSCSVIFPNYVMLNEAKYICKNIQRKQCLIDNQQQLEEEQERKKKNGDMFEASSDTVLDTNVYDSLLNITEANSVVMKAMGVYPIAKGSKSITNKAKEEESMDHLINHIEKNERMREQKLKQKKKKKNIIINKNSLNGLYVNTNSNPITNVNANVLHALAIDKQVSEYSKTKKNCFLNSIFNTKENKSKEKGRITKKNKTKIDQTIPLRTSSNILTRNQKQNIASLVSNMHNHSRHISINNTFSSPKLSSRIYYVVNKQIIPMKNNNSKTNNKKKVNSPVQNKYVSTVSNTNEYIPKTSRESKSKPKLSCKLELFELITSKIQKNPNLSKKTIGNISTTAPSFSLKTTNQNKHQRRHQQRSECFMSTSQNQKTLNDNLNDKSQRKHVSYHRNTRNAILNKIHSGLFSADFSASPLSELFKTTKQITFSNNLQRRTDRIIKSFHIKGFEDMLKKKEKGNSVSHSKRDKRSKKGDYGKSKSITKRVKE